MGESLYDWAKKNEALQLWSDLDIHSKSSMPEDFARLTMISVRQWFEMRTQSDKAVLDLFRSTGGKTFTSQIAEEISAERQRQKSSKGYNEEHDDSHDTGELADAAACYALSPAKRYSALQIWPWELMQFKPHGRRKDLIRSAALIIAEIERIDRKNARVRL